MKLSRDDRILSAKPVRFPYVVFPLLGIGLLWWVQHEYRFAKQSPEWPTAEGSVLESKVVVKTDEKNWDFRYCYVVDGVTYEHNRLAFGRLFYAKSAMEGLAGRFPKGTSVDVYYHPKNPSTATLEPGVNKYLRRFMWWATPLGLIFVSSLVYLFFPNFSLLSSETQRRLTARIETMERDKNLQGGQR